MAARLLAIKLDMMLDGGSLQASRMSDIKLDMSLDGGSARSSHVRHKIRYVTRWWLVTSSSYVRLKLLRLKLLDETDQTKIIRPHLLDIISGLFFLYYFW